MNEMRNDEDIKNLVAKLNSEQKQELIEYGVRFLESSVNKSWNQLVDARDISNGVPCGDFETSVKKYFAAKTKLKSITGIEYENKYESDLMNTLKQEGIKIK
ncbi:hypothetical protein KAT80_01785 [Candidatus Pacearchaeota archaeon]|nr:hypothetical protein [Candidatus Pacearchaeota archaeon]